MRLGNNLAYSSSYHPQIDGQTKIINRVLGNLQRYLTKEYGQSWDQVISQIEFAYNDNANMVIGKSSF